MGNLALYQLALAEITKTAKIDTHSANILAERMLASLEKEFSFEERLSILENHTQSTNQYLIKLSNLLSIDNKSTIDYSLIDDENTLKQLQLDNLAMSRVRYGLKQVTTNNLFDEYCRYIQLQAEELLNYFLLRKLTHIHSIQQFVIKNNPSYSNNIASKTPAKSVSDISFVYKLFAFNQVHPFKEYWTILQVTYVRNEASHRCSITGDKEDAKLCDFEVKGLAGRLRASLGPADVKLYDECEKIRFRREADCEKAVNALKAFYLKVTTNL